MVARVVARAAGLWFPRPRQTFDAIAAVLDGNRWFLLWVGKMLWVLAAVITIVRTANLASAASVGIGGVVLDREAK